MKENVMKYLEIEEKYGREDFIKSFVELFGVSLLLSGSLVTSEYKPSKTFGDIISLTKEGNKWVSIVRKKIKEVSREEICLALFAKFFHRDLFIEVNNTDKEKLIATLSEEIVQGKIRLPWAYSRLSYDRFNEVFPDLNTEELPYRDTMRLLEGQPQGVYQINKFVTGPFGILESLCNRFIMPLKVVPSWHCSDPGCTAIHTVELNSGDCKYMEILRFLDVANKDKYGASSEWYRFYRQHGITDDYYYDDMNVLLLPILLAEGFSENELKNILKEIINKNSKVMREQFQKNIKFKVSFSASAESIAESMDKSKCLQLILIMSDGEIIEGIEKLIESEVVGIPSTEIRKAVIASHGGGWLDAHCEASQFGIRSNSENHVLGTLRLKRLIKEVYKEPKEIKQLEWSLRHVEGESTNNKLDRYVKTVDPKEILRKLVMINTDKIQTTFELLRYGLFFIPDNEEEEERLINKILWKLGFNVKTYPSEQRRFWDRLTKLIDISGISENYNEYEREKVRSEAVNFFVSLEEILDLSLSFTTWVLMADHFKDTGFKFNLSDARSLMVSMLGERKLGGNEIRFELNGKNTLYPLIQGFRILVDLCGEIKEKRKEEFRRDKKELPGFYGKSQMQIFPFVHRKLILDINENDYTRIIGLLKEITDAFEKSNVCNIRNRIEHGGREFPNKREIEDACDAIRTIVGKIEEAGVCPIVYILLHTEIDQYSRGYHIYKNYTGREISVSISSQFEASKLPIADEYILFPWINIADTNEVMRFINEESSEYVNMWQNYPKRQKEI